jgi:hypothetical protein
VRPPGRQFPPRTWVGVGVVEVCEVLRGCLEGPVYGRSRERAGVDRKTARRYVEAAQAAGLSRDAGPGAVDDVLVGAVVAAVRPARPNASTPRSSPQGGVLRRADDPVVGQPASASPGSLAGVTPAALVPKKTLSIRHATEPCGQSRRDVGRMPLRFLRSRTPSPCGARVSCCQRGATQVDQADRAPEPARLRAWTRNRTVVRAESLVNATL